MMKKKRWTTCVQKGPPEFWIQWSRIPPAEKVSVETCYSLLKMPLAFVVISPNLGYTGLYIVKINDPRGGASFDPRAII
jgi:hypothetical protein